MYKNKLYYHFKKKKEEILQKAKERYFQEKAVEQKEAIKKKSKG